MARKDPKTCNTCRRRKVKCDGTSPRCGNCVKLRVRCDQPAVDYRFLIHTNQSVASNPVITGVEPGGTAAEIGLGEGADLAQQSPRIALRDPMISHAFSHYTGTLAPWYDLNDATQTFGVVVPARALDFPVLFRAIIALASSHWYKMSEAHTQRIADISFAFYATCVEDLLRALGSSSYFPGEYLAATCLLQLYEILNEQSTTGSPCHLLGAYSFSTSFAIDFTNWDLSQAGFWNYLREDITIALAYAPNRVVRIGKDLPQLKEVMMRNNIDDDVRANLITYILARTLNLYCVFNGTISDEDEQQPWTAERFGQSWRELVGYLALWNDRLPVTFQPFSTASKNGNAFPSLWMLKPWHVSSMQYATITKILLILLTPPGHLVSEKAVAFSAGDNEVQQLAALVCGLAYTNDNLAATLNAFGPLIFCGRYLSIKEHRVALVAMFTQLNRPIGYPIKHYITQLNEWWKES